MTIEELELVEQWQSGDDAAGEELSRRGYDAGSLRSTPIEELM